MATISFYRTVKISDEKKIKEIKKELRSDKRAFEEVPPATIDTAKEKEFIRKCLSLSKR